MDEKILKKIEKELKFHARGLSIPDGAAEDFISRTIRAVSKKFSRKSMITEADLKRAVYAEMKKYNRELAYIYMNYDRII